MEFMIVNVVKNKKVFQGVMSIDGVDQYILMSVDSNTNEILCISSQTVDENGTIDNSLIAKESLKEKIRKSFLI